MAQKLFQNKKALTILAGLIVALTAAAYYIYSRSPKFETVIALKQNITQKVIASGEIHSEDEANLNFSISGKIANILVEKNDEIKKGKLVASLDQTQLSATYQQALNNRRNTQAAVDSIHDQLKDKNSDETFAERATRTAAEVANDNAYDALRASEDALSKANLYSPINGVVTHVYSNIGESITTVKTIVDIADPNKLIFIAKVGESDIINVQTGQRATVKLDAFADKNFSGKVTEVDYAATNSTSGKYYLIKIALDNPDKIKLDMGGDAEIIINSKSDALVLPRSAVQKNGEQQYVEIKENGKQKQVDVTTGIIGENGMIEILSGLSEGDVAIVPSP